MAGIALAGFLALVSPDVRAEAGYADALKARLTDASASKRYPPGLAAFYAARGYAPLWVVGGSVNARGQALIAALRDADREGLDARYYETASLDVRSANAGTARASEIELGLSARLLRYAAHLRVGRVAPRIRYHGVAPPLAELPENLQHRIAASASPGAFFASLAPRDPAYGRLRLALARYRAIAKAGGWPAVRRIKGLAVGKTSPGVPALRRRLVAGGDLKADPANARVFDAAAAAALKRFQARHGLPESGFLDVLTLAALNVTAQARARSIVLNLERLRWVPDEVVRHSVIANAAGFELRAVENGKSRFYSRIIVGTCNQKTPRFVARITGVRFNPYWRVPQSIANNEILPRLKRDPGYLRRKGIRVLSDWGGAVLDPRKIDWKKLKRMPYKLRQEPGRGNALGRIRLLMPNPHNVYLHDTPSRKLFKRARRDFSHGCVRVARPAALAAYLLRGDPAWSLPAVKRAAASRRQRTAVLAVPVPIFIGYFTAWVTEDGTVNFRNDIYRRDAPLRRALKRTAARR